MARNVNLLTQKIGGLLDKSTFLGGHYITTYIYFHMVQNKVVKVDREVLTVLRLARYYESNKSCNNESGNILTGLPQHHLTVQTSS